MWPSQNIRTLPTYPNHIIYYISIKPIKQNQTQLDLRTYLKIWCHMWMLLNWELKKARIFAHVFSHLYRWVWPKFYQGIRNVTASSWSTSKVFSSYETLVLPSLFKRSTKKPFNLGRFSFSHWENVKKDKLRPTYDANLQSTYA